MAKFINQFVEVTNLLHELIFDLLDSIATDHTGDLEDVRIYPRRLGKEGLEVDFVGKQVMVAASLAAFALTIQLQSYMSASEYPIV